MLYLKGGKLQPRSSGWILSSSRLPCFLIVFYLLGLVAEKICKMIGSKIISFFEYIDSEDTTWAYLGKCLYRGSLFVPQLIVCVKTADLLP